MPLTFDATVKDMGRDSPQGVLAAFDRAPTKPIKLLNVDLSTVSAAADLIIGIGDPLEEIIHIDFQSSAAPWKHADLMVYHALLFAHKHVPVHTIIILLRPEAAHSNMNGKIVHAPRPGRGKMDFSYEIVRLWEHPAEELLNADIGLTPLAMLGRLPGHLSLEDGLRVVAHRVAERLRTEAAPDRANKLLTEALLLTGLRVRRDAARRVFQGVPGMQESDTYLMILDEGREDNVREMIRIVAEERFGGVDEAFRTQLSAVTDLARLKRMVRRAVKAGNLQEILETP